MKWHSLDGISVGDKRSFTKVVTDRDIRMFAKISGDISPIHLDSEIARKTIFKDRIAHGFLTAGFISAALSKFPGIIIYVSQSLYFSKPVRIFDKIEVVVEVLGKINERSELRLKTICTNQKGEIVLFGEAKVKVLEITNQRKQPTKN